MSGDGLAGLLSGIEERYRAVLTRLCGSSPDYLVDIIVSDLVGEDDALGVPITMPVARGILRKLDTALKLRGTCPATPPQGDSGASAAVVSSDGPSDGPSIDTGPSDGICGEKGASIPAVLGKTGANSSEDMALGLLTHSAAPDLMRCAVSGQLRFAGGRRRRKVWTLGRCMRVSIRVSCRRVSIRVSCSSVSRRVSCRGVSRRVSY